MHFGSNSHIPVIASTISREFGFRIVLVSLPSKDDGLGDGQTLASSLEICQILELSRCPSELVPSEIGMWMLEYGKMRPLKYHKPTG